MKRYGCIYFLHVSLVILFTWSVSGVLHAQDDDCPRVTELRKKGHDLNTNYDKIVEDLKAGLYCSQCKNSKTEIELSTKRPFEEHLQEVNGVAIPASQEMMDNAHQKYLDEFNRLKDLHTEAEADCKEMQDRKKEEEAQKKKDEADRLAREEEERVAKAAEAARIQRELEEKQKQEWIASESRRLAAQRNSFSSHYESLSKAAEDKLSDLKNRVLGNVNSIGDKIGSMFDHEEYVNALIDSEFESLDGEENDILTSGMEYGSWIANLGDDFIDNLIDLPAVGSVFRFGQDAQLKNINGELNSILDNFNDAMSSLPYEIFESGDVTAEKMEYLLENVKVNICNMSLGHTFADFVCTRLSNQ